MKRTSIMLAMALLLGSGSVAFAQSASRGQIPGTPDPVFGTHALGGSTDWATDQAPIPHYGSSASMSQDQQASYLDWQRRGGGGPDAQSNNVPIPSYNQPAFATTMPSQQTVQIVPFGRGNS